MSVFFTCHWWQKWTESCHKILFKKGLWEWGSEAIECLSIWRQKGAGRPKSTWIEVNIAVVADLVKNYHRITSRMIAESMNIPKTVVHQILKEGLGKRKLCARFVPHSLTPEQREDQVTSCQDITAMANADKNFVNKIIMGDESWCFAYDPAAKRQSSEWVGETSPWLKKLKFHRSRIKTMLIIFFDSQGVVHKEFIPEGKTVNADFYKGVMDCLLKCIQWVHPAVFRNQDFFLRHDSVPAQKAASVCQFLTQKNVTTLHYPMYSPDLSLPDYFLFPKLKMELKRTPLCRCCWDPRSCNWWIKEGPKRGIFGSYSETVQPHKSLYKPKELILN